MSQGLKIHRRLNWIQDFNPPHPEIKPPFLLYTKVIRRLIKPEEPTPRPGNRNIVKSCLASLYLYTSSGSS
jgi:hypothetical protein